MRAASSPIVRQLAIFPTLIVPALRLKVSSSHLPMLGESLGALITQAPWVIAMLFGVPMSSALARADPFLRLSLIQRVDMLPQIPHRLSGVPLLLEVMLTWLSVPKT